MKKSLLIAFVVSIVFSSMDVKAQFNKKTWMLLGYSALWLNAGGEKINQDGNKFNNGSYKSFYMKTAGAYFLLPSLAAGLAVNWQYDRYKLKSDIESSSLHNRSTTFYAGPFLRYYFYQLNAMMFYGEAMLAYGKYKSVSKLPSAYKSFEALLTAHALVGMSFFITQMFAIDVAMGYNWSRYALRDSNYISAHHQFMACIGLAFFIGQNAGLLNFRNYK